MASLTNQLNNVSFELASGTVNEITDEKLEGLVAVTKPDATSEHMLTALYCSSVKRPLRRGTTVIQLEKRTTGCP